MLVKEKQCIIKDEIKQSLKRLNIDKCNRNIVFMCIGSDRVIGDSYGPLVGQKLKLLINKIDRNNIKIIGDLSKTISSTCIEKQIEKIYDSYNNPYIIAIDAALGKKEDIGKIIISKKGLKYSSGFNNKENVVGDISIMGIVAKDYKIPKYNFNILQNIHLNIVMKMAEETAYGIYEFLK